MLFKALNFWVMMALVLLVSSAQFVRADSPAPSPTFLSPLFSNNMVLQRDHKDPVWGWTTPSTLITVQFDGKSYKSMSDVNGKWMVWLDSMPAGGPYTLDVTGPQSVLLQNVMEGDVWLCTGQSNMEFGLGMVKNAQAEVAAAAHPNIRLFIVQHAWGPTPQTAVTSDQWQVCSPQSVVQGGWSGFSAVGYFFARDLQLAHPNVPIGLLETCWGGTTAEEWTTQQTLEKLGDFGDVAGRLSALNGLSDKIARDSSTWADTNDAASLGFSAPAFDDSAWATMDLPGQWAWNGPIKGFVGVVWYREQFQLTASQAASDGVLDAGKIADTDTTWVNGVQVGVGAGRDTPRAYKVPASDLKTGTNVIAVRVVNGVNWAGGIWGDINFNAGDGTVVPLAGTWKYQTTFDMSTIHGFSGRPPADEASQASNFPSALYNGMIAPVAPFGIKGAVWYQGESNLGRAPQYRRLLPAMIGDWRQVWGEGDFPFYIVQISAYGSGPGTPGQSAWAELREAESIIANTTPNSGIVTTIDIGAGPNIHPPDKQDVGARLSLLARAKLYHDSVVYSGPVYKSFTVSGGNAIVSFDHVDGGLVEQESSAGLVTPTGLPLDGALFKVEPITGFEIAGADKTFYPANAQIAGDTVVLSSPNVTAPAFVHYGWADVPSCNLYNRAGLPAFPFRSEGPPPDTAH